MTVMLRCKVSQPVVDESDRLQWRWVQRETALQWLCLAQRAVDWSARCPTCTGKSKSHTLIVASVLSHSIYHVASVTQPLSRSLYHTVFVTRGLSRRIWHAASAMQCPWHSVRHAVPCIAAVTGEAEYDDRQVWPRICTVPRTSSQPFPQ